MIKSLINKEKSLSKALKPVVFIMKAMTAPTRTWKGPAPQLVSEMREIFEIYDKSYWILVFALPGMPKAEALQVVDTIVKNAPNKKGQKATGLIRGALDALLAQSGRNSSTILEGFFDVEPRRPDFFYLVLGRLAGRGDAGIDESA